jgi:extradiol dioxygenase family protein
MIFTFKINPHLDRSWIISLTLRKLGSYIYTHIFNNSEVRLSKNWVLFDNFSNQFIQHCQLISKHLYKRIILNYTVLIIYSSVSFNFSLHLVHLSNCVSTTVFQVYRWWNFSDQLNIGYFSACASLKIWIERFLYKTSSFCGSL